MSIPTVGITGGIGSGKSYICRHFETKGFQVYYADERARHLMHTNTAIIEGIKQTFGEQAYLPDGQLNRPYISQIVFQDAGMLQKINQIVHPETGKDFLNWVENLPKDYPHSFALKEAAILFESGAYKASQAVLTVYAPKKIRLERVMNRDQISQEAVLARMEKQWPEWKKFQRSDYLIVNDGKMDLALQISESIAYFDRLFREKQPQNNH